MSPALAPDSFSAIGVDLGPMKVHAKDMIIKFISANSPDLLVYQHMIPGQTAGAITARLSCYRKIPRILDSYLRVFFGVGRSTRWRASHLGRRHSTNDCLSITWVVVIVSRSNAIYQLHTRLIP